MPGRIRVRRAGPLLEQPNWCVLHRNSSLSLFVSDLSFLLSLFPSPESLGFLSFSSPFAVNDHHRSEKLFLSFPSGCSSSSWWLFPGQRRLSFLFSSSQSADLLLPFLVVLLFLRWSAPSFLPWFSLGLCVGYRMIGFRWGCWMGVEGAGFWLLGCFGGEKMADEDGWCPR